MNALGGSERWQQRDGLGERGLSFLAEAAPLPNLSSLLVTELIRSRHLLFHVGDSGICSPGSDPVPLSPDPHCPLAAGRRREEGPGSSSSLSLPTRKRLSTLPLPPLAPPHPPPFPGLLYLPFASPSDRSPNPTGSAPRSFCKNSVNSSVLIAFVLCQTLSSASHVYCCV